jgi:uncharacterized caspase-like protein
MSRWSGSLLGSFLLALTLLLGLAPSQAAPERRVALVIGNGAYKSAPALDNPTTDARGVSTALKRIGFEVIEGYDLGFSEMRAKLAEFAAALPDSRAALVYYAGHGVSVEEENFLLPVDIALKSVTDLDINAINIDLILRQMRREERVNVVILDACRDNPFAKELAASTKNRSAVADRGLSRIDVSAKGTLIAFATDPRSVAADGPRGGHSPFTAALLRHLETPGASIDTILNRVRADVWEATNKKQMPWVNTSLIGEFIMNPAPAPTLTLAVGQPSAAADPVAADPRVAQEQRMWDSAEKSNLPEDYKAYLDAYPTGAFAQMARNRIARAATEAPKAEPAKPAAAVVASAEPGRDIGKSAIDPVALKADPATADAEKSLALDKTMRTAVQQRLVVLGHGKVKPTGIFDPATRKAIAEWQSSRELAPTTYLGKVQFAALVEQSEPAYQRFLNAQKLAPKMPAQRSVRTEPKVSPGVAEAQRQRSMDAQAQADARRRAPPPNGPTPPPPSQSSGDAAAVGNFLGGVGMGLMLGGIRVRP